MKAQAICKVVIRRTRLVEPDDKLTTGVTDSSQQNLRLEALTCKDIDKSFLQTVPEIMGFNIFSSVPHIKLQLISSYQNN